MPHEPAPLPPAQPLTNADTIPAGAVVIATGIKMEDPIGYMYDQLGYDLHAHMTPPCLHRKLTATEVAISRAFEHSTFEDRLPHLMDLVHRIAKNKALPQHLKEKAVENYIAKLENLSKPIYIHKQNKAQLRQRCNEVLAHYEQKAVTKPSAKTVQIAIAQLSPENEMYQTLIEYVPGQLTDEHISVILDMCEMPKSRSERVKLVISSLASFKKGNNLQNKDLIRLAAAASQRGYPEATTHIALEAHQEISTKQQDPQKVNAKLTATLRLYESAALAGDNEARILIAGTIKPEEEVRFNYKGQLLRKAPKKLQNKEKAFRHTGKAAADLYQPALLSLAHTNLQEEPMVAAEYLGKITDPSLKKSSLYKEIQRKIEKKENQKYNLPTVFFTVTELGNSSYTINLDHPAIIRSMFQRLKEIGEVQQINSACTRLANIMLKEFSHKPNHRSAHKRLLEIGLEEGANAPEIHLALGRQYKEGIACLLNEKIAANHFQQALPHEDAYLELADLETKPEQRVYMLQHGYEAHNHLHCGLKLAQTFLQAGNKEEAKSLLTEIEQDHQKRHQEQLKENTDYKQTYKAIKRKLAPPPPQRTKTPPPQHTTKSWTETIANTASNIFSIAIG